MSDRNKGRSGVSRKRPETGSTGRRRPGPGSSGRQSPPSGNRTSPSSPARKSAASGKTKSPNTGSTRRVSSPTNGGQPSSRGRATSQGASAGSSRSASARATRTGQTRQVASSTKSRQTPSASTGQTQRVSQSPRTGSTSKSTRAPGQAKRQGNAKSARTGGAAATGSNSRQTSRTTTTRQQPAQQRTTATASHRQATESPRTDRTPHLGDDLLEQFQDARGRVADALECPPNTVGRPSRRAKVLTVAMFVCMICIAYSLAKIQIVDPDGLRQEATESRLRKVPIPAPRGQILDRNGIALASTIQRYDVEVDPVAAKEYRPTGTTSESSPDQIGLRAAARDLAALLPETEAQVYGKLIEPHSDPTKTRRWSEVSKEVSLEVWQKVRALRIPGVTSESHNRRHYSADNLAGSLLGFIQRNDESKPGAGLEIMYETDLRGKPGKEIREQGKDGSRIPLGTYVHEPVQPGRDVTLTIDRDIQWFAQKQVEEAVSHHKAEWGTVIVQDVATGELLAVAQSPEPAPAKAGNLKPAERRAHSFQSVIEPGSTTKVATVAAAIEDGVVSDSAKFLVPDSYVAKNGQKFSDSSSHKPEKLTLGGILAKSSNTGTIKVAEKMAKADRYEWLKKFGVGSKSGLNFPSESAGIFRPVEKWDKRTELQVMFGQGYAVTPIQASQVLAIVANGGEHAPPRLVRSVGDQTDVAKVDVETVPVVSSSTAKSVTNMLESVVTDGTAPQAAVPGYRVAGKTGTAEHASGRKGYDGYTSSFIGFAPAENPKFMVSVIVHRPTENGHYGGVVAGPVFSKVMGYSLQKYGVPPSTEAATPYPLTWK